jgi:quinol monooxygenase YgiN
MFLFQETYCVRPGLQDVVDQRVRSLHENHAFNPKFVATDWMKDLGDATTYLAFRLWRDADVTYNEAQTAWMAEYNRTRPADAFTQPPDIEYFEQVHQFGKSGGAGFLVYAGLRIGGRSPAMALEDELRDLLREADGLREYRLYRSLGGENRFVRAEFWRSQDEAIAFWRHEDRREFMNRLAAASTRGVSKLRHYAVLHQLGDAGMSSVTAE